MKTTVAFAGIVLGAATLSADTVVGWRETGGTNVAADAVTTLSGRLSIGAGGSFVKTGKGTLALSTGQLDKGLATSLTVLDGTLRVTPGAAPSSGVEQPPAVMQKAAFWVAADSDRFVLSGSGVSRWCDVRETNTATPTFPYAEPAWLDYKAEVEAQRTVAKGTLPPLETLGARKAVYFGGSGSGQHLNWFGAATGQKTSITGISHFFAVHAVSTAWGTVFGDYASSGGFIIDAAQMPTYDTVLTKGAHFFGAGVRGESSMDLK